MALKGANAENIKMALDKKIKSMIRIKDLMNKSSQKRSMDDIQNLVNIISGLTFFKEMTSLTPLDLRDLAFAFQIQ